MPYRDIIEYGSNHGSPTADDVAKHIIDLQNSGKGSYHIFMKLDKSEDGKNDDHRRWNAVGVALKKHFKVRAKERRKFKSDYIKMDGDELEVSQYVKNSTQLKLALKYQFMVLPKLLDDFSKHSGTYGNRSFLAKQKQLMELIEYCKDTKNPAYHELKDITLGDPMTKPEFKKKVKQVLIFRFMTMGVEGYMINKTNAEKLVGVIFLNAKKGVVDDGDFEFLKFDMIFKNFTSLDEALKNHKNVQKDAKELFGL